MNWKNFNYGLSITIPDTNSISSYTLGIQAGHGAEVHLELDGVTKEFTGDEFKRKLGFE